ncbi:LysR substrate-binding domain-containing protein [Frateuria aurantia]
MDERIFSVSLRKLHAFTKVCETLHMARAADLMGISQPALSEQIQRLERALGIRLFHRRKRGIDLTEAGHQLYQDASDLLSRHHAMLERAGRVARGEMGRLALGHVGSAMFDRQLTGQLNAMHTQMPDVQLMLREAGGSRLMEAVEQGDLDIVLVRAPLVLGDHLRHRVHSCQRLRVVLPLGHALSRCRRIGLKQLEPYQLVDYAEADQAIGITPMIRELARSSGIQLKVTWQVTTVGSVLGLVASGQGIGIVPDHSALRVNSTVTTRALHPAIDSELWLVWHAERETPTVRQFLSIVDAVH